MKSKVADLSDKSRVKVHYTRLQKRQATFGFNRPVDNREEVTRTPKPRNQKRGPKRKKDLAVEPGSDRRLFRMDNNNIPDPTLLNVSTGSGEIAFDSNGRSVEEVNTVRIPSSSAALTQTTNTNQTQRPIGTGAIPKASQTNKNSAPTNRNSLSNQNQFGFQRTPQTNDFWNFPSTPAVTMESVKNLISQSQERSMQLMTERFEQLLKTHLQPPPQPQNSNNNKRHNRNRKQNNENFSHRNDINANKNVVENPYCYKNQNEFRIASNYNDGPQNNIEFESNRFAENSSFRQNPGEMFSPQNFRQSLGSSVHSINNMKVQLDKWNLKFDGSNVEEFWFKIECCKESSPYSWDQVFKHFHCLLNDRLQRWYWRFRENNRNAGIQLLRNTMLDSFRTRESDLDIWGLIMKRKQRVGEKFDDFWKEIEDLTWRFKVARPSEDIIGALRSIVLPEISLALTVYETDSLSKFLDKCREADRNIKNQFLFQNRFNRRVNEIELVNENEHALEALRLPFKKEDKVSQKRENISCANCDSEKHLWRDCPSDRRRIFCYRCCFQGVTTPKCPNCHPENAENSKISD